MPQFRVTLWESISSWKNNSNLINIDFRRIDILGITYATNSADHLTYVAIAPGPPPVTMVDMDIDIA